MKSKKAVVYWKAFPYSATIFLIFVFQNFKKEFFHVKLPLCGHNNDGDLNFILRDPTSNFYAGVEDALKIKKLCYLMLYYHICYVILYIIASDLQKLLTL